MSVKKVHFVVRPLNEREIPDDVDDPVLAKTYLELAYSLETEVAPYGWDQPPQLVLLRVKARATQQGAAAVVVDGTPLPGFHLLVSRYMQKGGRMHHALLHAAEAWEDLVRQPIFRRLDMSEIQGLALIHEGWALLGPDVGREEYERAQKERKIHQHPDRVEVRLVNVAGPNGLRVALNLPRDGVPIQMIGQAAPGKDPRAYGMAGEVPNALQYFLEVVQGQQPGEWETWSAQYDYELAIEDEVGDGRG